MDLSGTWRALPADEELRRTGIGLDVDDSGWEAVPIPGHWRSVPAFANSDGPLLHRTRFELEPPTEQQRHWLVLEGVFYQGDVWLDGAYVGDTEGYFFPHTLEITELARLGREHALAVEVACAPQHDKTAKRNITGVFQHWDCMDPDWNPGGLWRPVRIDTTGPVRIRGLQVLCREADAARAVLTCKAELDSLEARSVTVRTVVGDATEVVVERPIAKGANDVTWTVTIDDPDLWWPWALGAQPLYDVTVEVSVDGVESHARTVRTGLRQVAMRKWVLSVNGERLFAKGANLAPTRMALGEATPAELRRDIELARDAGLDLVRMHAHISRPELYDAADELGMLVWQDFPLQWGYARSVRKQAVRQVRKASDLLAHHPSIALWCGHNEPIALDVPPGQPPDSRAVATRFLAGQELPLTWNRTVLDNSVKRAFEKADDSRPVVAHSGIAPHLPQLDGTDSHLYFGWYHGEADDLPGFAAAWPRMVRFVTEFGAQAVPEDAAFMEPARWPDLDWEHLGRHHALQKAVFDRRVPPDDYATFAEWKTATQRYQAQLLKQQIEALRRLKYRPTGGFAMFVLNDAIPAVSWSVLGHDRAAKEGYTALAEACRPVIITSDHPPATIEPGRRLELAVHVVNDLRHPLDGAVATARLHWPGGERSWRWQGDVEADAVAKVGTIDLEVPNAPGPLVIDLDLIADDTTATNRYTTHLNA